MLMASFPIEPIATRTLGGYIAVISSIDPFHQDCLDGYIVNAKENPTVFKASWDRSGICRDNQEAANIVISKDQRLAEIINIIDRTVKREA